MLAILALNIAGLAAFVVGAARAFRAGELRSVTTAGLLLGGLVLIVVPWVFTYVKGG